MPGRRLELHQLRCFVAVAEELHFRRAAERLNMTQPPLSRQIRILEERIGLTLFDRSTTSVRLTPAGKSLFSSAGELLQRAEHAVLSARQAARGDAGAIAMGFVPSAGLSFVPRIVDAMARLMPAVTFRPTEMMSYEISEALRSGRLDFGLTRTAGRDDDIETLPVVSEPFVLALPKTHPLAARTAMLRDLDGVAFIAYSADRGGFLREVHQRLFASAGIAPRTVYEVSQTVTMLALVDRGLGVALVPRSAQAVRMANLCYRDIAVPDSFRSDLYLTVGPKCRTALHGRVRAAIVAALEAD